jgi:uncharacterized protein YacL
MVEAMRLIMVSLFAVAGWEVASRTGPQKSGRLLVGIVVGSGVGFVLGGALGRRTASAVSEVEREFRRIPAADALSATIGLVVALGLAALLAVPLFHLPPAAAYPTVAFVYVTAGTLGYRVGRSRSEELLALFGVKPRAAGGRAGDVAVVDTSALLDGRILSLVRMGFLGGTLLVSRSVVEELQAVADSSDEARRSRGRRALDLLVALRRDPGVDVVLVEEGDRPGEPVDAQLVRLARARGAVLVSNDAALGKVAAALDVPVRSIHALADALRPPVVAGEQIPLRLSRPGRSAGQAVGYLEDGTMVVVEEADHLIGETVPVAVTNALRTATGQMVFARLPEAPTVDRPA